MSQISRSTSAYDNKLLNDFMDNWEREREQERERVRQDESWTSIGSIKEEPESIREDIKVEQTEVQTECLKRSASDSFDSPTKKK
ncbi:hypothetical protein BpHYR1_024253 [Brachionus plicatilis]|uniref:Uncharacterized protein n=1 Tax=Brachionus plicatilis TaxID=10195 RepID=A0A3M7PJJ8_BRAPC|nr:hypothetical protein BpHYR1_024253 [Brachionus plicatilis]